MQNLGPRKGTVRLNTVLLRSRLTFDLLQTFPGFPKFLSLPIFPILPVFPLFPMFNLFCASVSRVSVSARVSISLGILSCDFTSLSFVFLLIHVLHPLFLLVS